MCRLLFFLIALVSGPLAFGQARAEGNSSCLIGAFLADKPTQEDITDFQKKYGKKPSLVMVFVDWESFVDKQVIDDVYGQGCALVVTWEPWDFVKKEAADYSDILSGEYDRYIALFASQIKAIGKEIFIRFAHEPNGDWYPWSGYKLGAKKYISMYRHIRNVFDKTGAKNVKWIFSVNWEDLPKENNYLLCYPGDAYTDYIGIDGYNWGASQTWSKWMGFADIFRARYNDITVRFNKPVIITEFSSTGKGGNKCAWIKDALDQITKMDKIKAFILFNVNKETDWNFADGKESCVEFRDKLKNDYFK